MNDAVPLPNDPFLGSSQPVGNDTQAPTSDMFIGPFGFQPVASLPIPPGTSLPDMGMSMIDAATLTIDDNLFTAFNSYAVSNKRDPLACEIGITERSRINFVIRQLKTYPTLLVKHGKTPFIHSPASYPLIPLPLQDAISASALYLSKK